MGVELQDESLGIIDDLPDIRKEIGKVFEIYYQKTGNINYAIPFLDAWLDMQKEEGKVLLYRKIQTTNNAF